MRGNLNAPLTDPSISISAATTVDEPVAAALPTSRLTTLTLWTGTVMPLMIWRLLAVTAYFALVYVLLLPGSATDAILSPLHAESMAMFYKVRLTSTFSLATHFLIQI